MLRWWWLSNIIVEIFWLLGHLFAHPFSSSTTRLRVGMRALLGGHLSPIILSLAQSRYLSAPKFRTHSDVHQFSRSTFHLPVPWAVSAWFQFHFNSINHILPASFGHPHYSIIGLWENSRRHGYTVQFPNLVRRVLGSVDLCSWLWSLGFTCFLFFLFFFLIHVYCLVQDTIPFSTIL